MRLRVQGTILAAALLVIAGSDGRMLAAPGASSSSLAKLKSGNARFVSSPQDALPVDAGRRAALAKGQTPFATVLSCADSRVPPEIVFHTGLGDLFVVRAAGNITDKAILASVEYSVEHLNVPLVVVMGHESCGAVKAAVETPAGQSLGPNLDYLVSAIRPSVNATASRPEAERMRAAILANVEETLNDMLTGSAILREAGKEGKVAFVGAYYELASGKVYFSEPVAPPPGEPRATGGHQ
ncbi:MAG: carbonic anhydrase [Acidobacteria bacterium]|nr:carbonic anhydrase [Acidobacteriota bacterium]